MPKARAPNAPWVAVWLSPQTMVVPGRVKPCSGPMMWTIPLRGSSKWKSSTPNSCAVADQGVDLELRVIADALAAVGGDVVVDDRDGRVRAAHSAPGLAQPLVGLGRGHLVGEVAVDVEQAGAVFLHRDDVAVPDLFEQSARLRPSRAPVRERAAEFFFHIPRVVSESLGCSFCQPVPEPVVSLNEDFIHRSLDRLSGSLTAHSGSCPIEPADTLRRWPFIPVFAELTSPASTSRPSTTFVRVSADNHSRLFPVDVDSHLDDRGIDYPFRRVGQ